MIKVMVIPAPTVPKSVFEMERHPMCPPDFKRKLRAFRHGIDSMRTRRVRVDKIVGMPKFALPVEP